MAFNKLTVFVADKTNQIINFYKQKVEKVSTEPVFIGSASIAGQKTKIASIFGKDRIDDIAAEVLNDYDCDIAIIVDSSKGEVHFRKKTKCKVNLGNLASKLCEGGGNVNIASGKITENFLNFTKILQKA